MRDYTEEQQRVIRLIDKLLKLAAGTTSTEEAESAHLKAQKLMAEYDLSLADITVEEFRERAACDEHEIEILPGKCPDWVALLAAIINDIYGTRGFRRNEGDVVSDLYIFFFIGVEPNVTVAAQAFVSVYRHLVLRKYPLKYTAKQKADFAYGFVTGLYKKLREAKEAQMGAAPENCTAIALARSEIADKYVAEHYPHLKSAKFRVKKRDDEAVASGVRAGQQYNITAGVRGSHTARIQ